jgi:TolB-like protein/tetratricopeptide (TPR) repeat protein
MGERSFETHPAERSSEKRLDSWKEIAAYLNRDVTTVQRWEKREGMPVHRHVHDRGGSVYALLSELDAWAETRRACREDQETAGVEAADARGEQKTSGTPRTRPWLALVGMLALGLPAVAYFAWRGEAGRAALPKIKSLAVLPLKNLSGDPAQEYLADGMTEALIGRLATINGLRVISRTSAMQFKDTHKTVPEIGEELNVDSIVEGSVIREGNRIRVFAQLIRAATDEHLWSATYDRELRDVLVLQSDVSQAIAGKVEVALTGKERERLTATRTVSPEVYESFLKGSFALDKGDTETDIDESIRYFGEAIKKDATFSPAYIGLAEAHDQRSTIFIGAPPEEERAKGIDAVRKALELDPDSAEGHVLLAEMLMSQWQWPEAEGEFERALELNPNDAAAHDGFAHWLLSQGDTGEALTWARKGRELDPLAMSGSSIGWILFQSQRYDEAIKEFRSVLAVRPEDAGNLWSLGFALIANGQPGEAIPVLEKALSISNRSPGISGVLVRAYAHAGRRADALRLLAELKRRKQAGYVPAGAFVNAYLGLGDNDEAFVWLEQAYKEHSNILLTLKTHPYFDPLRDDPRFKDLVRRIGLA